MAEAKETHVDVLDCTICLETLRNPKSLPCLHTFCARCLVSYITSGLEKHQENINCPLCRETVNRPSKTCSPEACVENIPSNFLLAGLIERRKVERPEKLCMLCERAGKQPIEKATFFCTQCTDTLCKTCEHFHRFSKLSSGHNVKPITEISNDDKLFPEPRNTCCHHKNETLKLYCIDHKTLCCCVCVSISHRKCEEVKSLEDVAKQIATSKEIKDIELGYERLEKDFEDDIIKNKMSSEKLENDYETALQTIESKYEVLRKAMNEQESQRKSELEKVYCEMKDRKEGILIGLENKQRMIKNERKVFDACLQGASETQIFIEMTNFQKRIKAHEDENKDFRVVALKLGSGLMLESTNTEEILSLIKNSFKIQQEHVETFQITRFPSLGSGSKCWNVNSEIDAILFEVSTDILLYGFLSYGCKENGVECSVQISVKDGDHTLVELKKELSKELTDYTNNIVVELKIDEAIKLSPYTRYEVIFVMESEKLCNYGHKGQSEVECKGVTFKFFESDKSNNGTKLKHGQIPGFMFTKMTSPLP